jgi:general secretion pathway protein C
VGWRLFAIRPDTLWGLLGFQNGDRLMSVNGIEIVSLEGSPAAQAALKSASDFAVQIVRKGAATTLEIRSE